jgi:mono/diheme cytochrome c family protein
MRKALKIIGLIVAVLMLAGVVAIFVLARKFDAMIFVPNTPYPEVVASKDPEVIARGEYLVRAAAHCTQCHGGYERMHPENNTHDVPISGGLKFDFGPLGATWGANLTPDAETGIGRRSDAELARTLVHGVLPDGTISIFMRFGAHLAREDLIAVISYLRSLPPTKKAVEPGALTLLGRAAFSMAALSPRMDPLPAWVPAGDEPSVARGEYLAEHVALCVACHSRFDEMTFQPVGPKAAGSTPGPSPGDDKDKELVAPNLTADPKTGVTGKLDEDAFLARMRTPRAFASSIMPWENLSRMTDNDLRSIYRYLKTLPPIENDVGPTYRDVGWKPPK